VTLQADPSDVFGACEKNLSANFPLFFKEMRRNLIF